MEETTKQLLTTIAENQPKIKEVGYNEGFSAGKKAEYDAFWDAIQANGTRKNYEYAFARWNSEYIRPKYKVINTSRAMTMFSGNTSLKIVEKQYFDLSQASTNATQSTGGNYQTFAYCDNLEMIEDIGMKAGYYHDTFRSNPKLHTIEVMRVTEDCGFSATCFVYTQSLKNIIVDGVIGKTISFSYSPLTVASLKSIITHLKDYSGTTSEKTYTITFKASAFEALEAEGNTSPNGNTWTEYIDDLKWNLALA